MANRTAEQEREKAEALTVIAAEQEAIADKKARLAQSRRTPSGKMVNGRPV